MSQKYTTETLNLEPPTVAGVIITNVSPSGKYLCMCTRTGLLLAKAYTLSFYRFEGERSPFWRRDSSLCSGVMLASLLEEREEVGCVPLTSDNTYNHRTVYVYNYSLEVILCRCDFFAPIRVLAMTSSLFIVASRKRLILKNYCEDQAITDLAHYLKIFRSEEKGFRRYLRTKCYCLNECSCGYFRMAYSEGVHILWRYYYLTAGTQFTNIHLYSQQNDNDSHFLRQPSFPSFIFGISPDASLGFFASAGGRGIHLYNLPHKQMIGNISLGFFTQQMLSGALMTTRIQGQPDSQWMGLTIKQNAEAAVTYIYPTSPAGDSTEIACRYTRSIELFPRISEYLGSIDAQPILFTHGARIYSSLSCGVAALLLDLTKTEIIHQCASKLLSWKYLY